VVFCRPACGNPCRLPESVCGCAKTAKTIGLDVNRLKADMQDPKISAQLDKNIELAHALNINGTPGFVIGEVIFASATDLKTLQGLIGQARKLPPENR
jgi:protein-disulfide isomerase